MKNNKLSILIALVIFIWGVIGFKVYQHLSEDSVLPIAKKKAFEDVTEEQQTFELDLSYDDPFLRKTKKKTAPVLKNPAIIKPMIVLPTQQPVVDWSVIKFLGVVYNTTRKTKMASVRINENEYFLKEGELMEGFVIQSITSDSMKVTFGTAEKSIKR